MLGLLLRQRMRLFWNRLAQVRRPVLRLIGACWRRCSASASSCWPGLNAGLLVERIGTDAIRSRPPTPCPCC